MAQLIVFDFVDVRSLYTDRDTDRDTDRCKNCTDRTDRERGVIRINPLSRGLYGLYSFYSGLYPCLYHGLYTETVTVLGACHPQKRLVKLLLFVKKLQNS